ncbi:MAG: hypothetical protein QW403_03340 [Candidatus Aenigmatarchaeota archaeon]
MKLVKLLLFFLLIFLFFPLTFGKIGIGIAPGSGNYNFTLDGGTIDFTVYNTGDSDMVYTLTLSGNASNFTSVEPTQMEIKANSYGVFKATINPTKEVKEGETYILIASARALTSGSIGVGAESRITIYFEGPRTKPYEQPYLLYLLIIVVIVAASVSFLIYKKFKKGVV